LRHRRDSLVAVCRKIAEKYAGADCQQLRQWQAALRTGSFVVARPAVLYIGDVPVMWLPFLFQDIRSGRRSGIIAPNVGVSIVICAPVNP